jgi:hypothetical protein
MAKKTTASPSAWSGRRGRAAGQPALRRSLLEFPLDVARRGLTRRQLAGKGRMASAGLGPARSRPAGRRMRRLGGGDALIAAKAGWLCTTTNTVAKSTSRRRTSPRPSPYALKSLDLSIPPSRMTENPEPRVPGLLVPGTRPATRRLFERRHHYLRTRRSSRMLNTTVCELCAMIESTALRYRFAGNERMKMLRKRPGIAHGTCR